jgi:VWFA-related protein
VGIVALLFAAALPAQDNSAGKPVAPASAGSSQGATGQVSVGGQPVQNPDPGSHTGAHPLRATTRAVQVNVIVQDKSGNPISDLTKADFTVYDNKKPREVRTFSVLTTKADGVTAAPPKLFPDTYANRVQNREGVPNSITIVLFDALNTPLADQFYARKQIIKFLEKQIQPQDRIALYTLGQKLHVLHDFTSDTPSLLAALAKYEGQLNPQLAASTPEVSNTGLPQKDAFLNFVYHDEANQRITDRVSRTILAMREIADHVAAVPGRKNLVWVSGSFPFSVGFNGEENAPQIDQRLVFVKEIETASQALTNANVAVHPVDARGLMTPSLQIDSGAGDLLGGASVSDPTGSFQGPDVANFQTMETLAQQTGGRAFYNTNDVKGAIRRAIDDSRVTYELTFYPEDIKWDGSFHSLRVEVKRKGAAVHSRKGYFAVPEPDLTPKLRQQVIAETALSPLEATGIGVVAQVHVEDPADHQAMKVLIGFDPREFSLQLTDGLWRGSAECVTLQLDDANKIIASTDETIRLHLDPAAYEKASKEGMAYARLIRVKPNAVQMRVVLRNPANGNIGDVSVPFAKYFPAKTN